MDEVTIRPAGPRDGQFLLRVLLMAMNWNPNRPAADERVVHARPELAHYVAGWPRPDDFGVVAEARNGPIGAAWFRRLPASDPGYGYVADDVPELTIGVVEGWRGRGVGGWLLDALLHEARARGLSRVSLSVERDNPALALYVSRGFRGAGTNGGALTMVRDVAKH